MGNWVKYSDVGARVGDTVRGHNGYEYVIREVGTFELGMGSVSAGLHNERISLQDCDVWVGEGEPEENLSNFDLVNEMSVLGGFIARARECEIDVDDFNHSLLEDDVEEFRWKVWNAVEDFVTAVRHRRDKVLKELEDRGVVEL